MKTPAFLKNPDVVGWLLWAILTIVLIPPSILLYHWITYDATTSQWTRFVAGLFTAAIGAGVLSWLGTEIWFRIHRRHYAARRKAKRKEKRKKK